MQRLGPCLNLENKKLSYCEFRGASSLVVGLVTQSGLCLTAPRIPSIFQLPLFPTGLFSAPYHNEQAHWGCRAGGSGAYAGVRGLHHQSLLCLGGRMERLWQLRRGALHTDSPGQCIHYLDRSRPVLLLHLFVDTGQEGTDRMSVYASSTLV